MAGFPSSPEPGEARRSQEEPGGDQEEPGGARRSQKEGQEGQGEVRELGGNP